MPEAMGMSPAEPKIEPQASPTVNNAPTNPITPFITEPGVLSAN
jgi:hypothetical protein